MKHCRWCDNSFTTQISYQIYCSSGCREEATKEKIAARYLIVKRSKRAKNPKKCSSCDRVLSVYNDDPICLRCTIDPKEVSRALREIRKLSNGKE